MPPSGVAHWLPVLMFFAVLVASRVRDTDAAATMTPRPAPEPASV